MNANRFDVIIVGAGSMGMSTGYYLARSGVRVLMIDAFDPPHGEGSHHGDTRLIRHAYKKGELYNSLALRADELWVELEQYSENQLLSRSGVLNIGDPEHYSFANRAENAHSYGIATEMLDASEIHKRWPGIVLPESFIGLYEPQAGYLFSEKCISTYRKLALEAGAQLLTYSPVLKMSATSEGITVETKDGIFYADQALVSVGAFFSHFNPFLPVSIQPVRIALGWFETERPIYQDGQFPGFTLHTSEGGYYGFPDNGGGLKIGRHDKGINWKVGTPLEPFGHYEQDERWLRQVVQSYFPKAAGKLLRGSVCKYEFTADEDFIIDRSPNFPNVVVAGGFSGHGFKFASVIGEITSQLLLHGKTKLDISPFALSRFSL